MNSFLHDVEPLARKKHKCIWCNELINVGEKYHKQVGRFDGEFQSNVYHLECFNASIVYFTINDNIDNLFEEGSFKRGTYEDRQ